MKKIMELVWRGLQTWNLSGLDREKQVYQKQIFAQWSRVPIEIALMSVERQRNF